MNAEHEEAVEFAKVSKRENRVYVGNLSYDVKYRDLMEFMRGGGWGNFSFLSVWGRGAGGGSARFVCGLAAAASVTWRGGAGMRIPLVFLFDGMAESSRGY